MTTQKRATHEMVQACAELQSPQTPMTPDSDLFHPSAFFQAEDSKNLAPLDNWTDSALAWSIVCGDTFPLGQSWKHDGLGVNPLDFMA